MSKDELKAVLDRHRGSQGEIADELGCTRQTVCGWFGLIRGSNRVEMAIRRKVAELLAKEKEAADAHCRELAELAGDNGQ